MAKAHKDDFWMRSPHKATGKPESWWYFATDGILVYTPGASKGFVPRIPWRQVKAALRRLESEGGKP